VKWERPRDFGKLPEWSTQLTIPQLWLIPLALAVSDRPMIEQLSERDYDFSAGANIIRKESRQGASASMRTRRIERRRCIALRFGTRIKRIRRIRNTGVSGGFLDSGCLALRRARDSWRDRVSRASELRSRSKLNLWWQSARPWRTLSHRQLIGLWRKFAAMSKNKRRIADPQGLIFPLPPPSKLRRIRERSTWPR